MARYSDLPSGANKIFPAHGWILGRTGVRLIRLPVFRLYQIGEPTHRHFIEKALGGVWLQYRSPYRTLRQIAVCLRDLHRQTREILQLMNDGKMTNNLQQKMEGQERSEILITAAFVLLRRLADELISASSPFLFEKSGCAPGQMKNAKKWAEKNSLESLNPICDLDALTDALLNHTSWWDRLRHEGGIRDILTHKPHDLIISPGGSRAPDEENINWRAEANLMRERPHKSIELFSALREILDGACNFMARLCVSAGLADGYQQGDCLFLTGEDNDIVGFWPPIEGKQEEFPLMD